MSQHHIMAGDVVEYKGVKYYVTKRAQVNFQVKRVSDGTRFNLRIHPVVKYAGTVADLNDAEKAIVGITTPSPGYGSLDIDAFKDLYAGTVVRLKDEKKRPNKWNYAPGTLFIVLKHNYDKVNIARLGGDKGRYWRMGIESIEIVNQ